MKTIFKMLSKKEKEMLKKDLLFGDVIHPVSNGNRIIYDSKKLRNQIAYMEDSGLFTHVNGNDDPRKGKTGEFHNFEPKKSYKKLMQIIERRNKIEASKNRRIREEKERILNEKNNADFDSALMFLKNNPDRIKLNGKRQQERSAGYYLSQISGVMNNQACTKAVETFFNL